MSAFSRPVMLLLAGLSLLTVAVAVLNTLVPLWLIHHRHAVWQIGMVSSSWFSGNLLGTLIAGSIIRRCGFKSAYYLATLVLALSTLWLGSAGTIVAWSSGRFIAGTGCALIWVVVESALMKSGAIRYRGQLLASYMMVYYLGNVAGQLLVSKVSTELSHVLPWVTAITLAAIIPLLFCRLAAHADGRQAASPAVWLLLYRRSARVGIVGCVISGVILGSLYGLMPLYLSHRQLSDASVGYWMALLISAGIVGQWPVGWLADRFGRLLVLRIQVFVLLAGAVAMFSDTAMGPSLFLMGCAGFTLYPVAMYWACHSVTQDELVTMNQALLLSYTVGSLMGPAVTAVMMHHFSDNLLFITIALAALIYLVILERHANHPVTPVAQA